MSRIEAIIKEALRLGILSYSEAAAVIAAVEHVNEGGEVFCKLYGELVSDKVAELRRNVPEGGL